MYNITLIDKDGFKYISVDNLEKVNYSEIKIHDSELNVLGMDSLEPCGMWVGDAAPENLEVIIDSETKEQLHQIPIVLDYNKLVHITQMVNNENLHVIQGCQEDFASSFAAYTGSSEMRVYLKINPKFIGLPLGIEFVLAQSQQIDVNWNDHNDSFYFIDLSNLKSSLGSGGLQYLMSALFLSVFAGIATDSVGCPLFLDNKELTLSTMSFADFGAAGEMAQAVRVISKKHFNNLNSLEDGSMMFMGCSKIKDFPYQLPKLSQSSMMFSFSGIKDFKINMPSLKNATYNVVGLGGQGYDAMVIQTIFNMMYGMFSNSELETFVSDMPELTLGDGMFAGCSNLTTFVGSLENLKSGRNMFGRGLKFKMYEQLSDALNAYLVTLIGALLTGAGEIIASIEEVPNSSPKLTSMSVINILDTLPDRGVAAPSIDFSDSEQYIATIEGIITIGIGAYEENRDEFANEIGFDSFDELTAAFNEKGWAVEWIFQQTSTYSLRRNTKKFYKLIEYTGEIKLPSNLVKSHNLPETIKVDDLTKNPKAKLITDKLKPEYKSNTDSTKLYRLAISESNEFCKDWEEFESLEEALAHFDVSPIEE